MALARTDLIQSQSTPLNGNNGTGNWTTAAFTPPAGALLVVAVGAMVNSATVQNVSAVQTISDSQGLTWTAQVRSGGSFAFSDGMVIFTATGAAAVSTTITVGTGGLSVGVYFVHAAAYTGFDTGTPINGTALATASFGGNHTTPLAVTGTLSAAPAAGDEVFCGIDVNKSSPFTISVGSTYTVITGAFLTNTNWGATSAETRTGSTSTTVDWVDVSNASTVFDYAMAAVVVKVASGGTTINGTATLTGAGALADVASTQIAPATLSGAGALTPPNSIMRAPATLTGAGALTPPNSIQRVAGTTLTGAGSMANVNSIMQAGSSLVGVGLLVANAGGTVTGTASLVGAGSMSAAVTVLAPATLTGAGALTAPSILRAGATLVGAGAVALVPSRLRAGATLVGAGSLVAAQAGSIHVTVWNGSAEIPVVHVAVWDGASEIPATFASVV